MGGCVLVFIRQAGRVGKHRIGAPELRRAGIHLRHKSIHGAADVLRHLQGDVVGGGHHDGVQTLLHGEDLVELCRNICAAVGDAGHARGGHGYLVREGTVFQGKQAGHDLYGAPRKESLIHVFGIENGARVFFQNHGSLRGDVGALGPAGNLIGADGRAGSGFLGKNRTHCVCGREGGQKPESQQSFCELSFYFMHFFLLYSGNHGKISCHSFFLEIVSYLKL